MISHLFCNPISQNECFRKNHVAEKIKLVVNTKAINTYKNYERLHCPFSINFRFPLGTVEPCFVSEKVTTADPRTVRFDKILIFWATTVIQVFYISSGKSGQQSTLFESRSKHFCNQYLYVVKDSKEINIIQLSTTPLNSM